MQQHVTPCNCIRFDCAVLVSNGGTNRGVGKEVLNRC
jgi:hypothetical protein